MLGYYIRSCHVITCNMRETWGLFYLRNENIAHVMPHVTTCAITSCMHCVVPHAGKPANLIIRGAPGITYGCAIHAGQMILIKNNYLAFWHPKYENCKPECAEKDSHCHAQ